MAYTQADADSLRAALASGASRVTVNGRTIEYRSVQEIERALARVERELSAKPAALTSYAGFRRD